MVTHVTGWETQPPPTNTPAPAETLPRTAGPGLDSQQPVARRAARQEAPESPRSDAEASQAEQPKKPEKKSLFRRLIGVFK